MPASLLHLVRIGLAALLLVGTSARADTYTYDVLGNLSTLSSDRGTRSFTYDELNRLKTEAGFTGTRAHAYDANTNRSTNGAAPPTLVTYTPASNRIATLNGLAVTFDAAGNLLADDLYTYTWDEVGRLKTVSKSGTLLATYAYDHRNRRSRKTTTAAAPQGAQTILYHYDQDDHLIAESRSDGTPLRTYAWLGELPITIIEHAALSTPPRTLHLQHDHLGTPRLAKNDAGIVQWRWDSDGYGASAPSQDPDGDGKYTSINLRFPGQYYDLESGLHYNWNRYYSPRLGRYISPDPIGIEGGSNAYAYVEGNPLRYADPRGLATILGRPQGFSEGLAWARKYPDLIRANENMRERIKKLCSKDRERLQRIFDNWTIYVDPNIENPAKRARQNYAVTKFSNQSTQFNFAFFNMTSADPGVWAVFAHEFRHLMNENNALVSSSDLGAVLAGRAGDSRYEQDANAWARKFLDETCTCGY